MDFSTKNRLPTFSRAGKAALKRIIKTGIQLARALDHAHKRGTSIAT